MARHVVQRFLQHAVHVYGHGLIRHRTAARGLVVDMDAGLLFKHGQVLPQGRFQAGLLDHGRMQRLRKRADLVEGGLDDLLYLLEVRAQGRVHGLSATAGPLQHGADGSQNLAELVVQLARDVTEGTLLHGDQLLGEFAAPVGQRGDLIEHAAIVLHQVEPVGQQDDQDGRQEQVDIALCAGVDLAGLGGGLFFVVVVLDQQARDRRGQGRLARFERDSDAGARFGLIGLGKGEDAVERVPELGRGGGKVLARPFRTEGGPELSLAGDGVFQVDAKPLELRLPGGERVVLAAVQHVAQGHVDQVQIVLNAQQQHGIGAIAVDSLGLQLAEPAHLDGGVGRIDRDRRKRDRQSGEQSDGGRST